MSEIPEGVIKRAIDAYWNAPGKNPMRAAARVIAEWVRAEERAAVVAHLRMIAEFEYGLSSIADAIEAGEHRR